VPLHPPIVGNCGVVCKLLSGAYCELCCITWSGQVSNPGQAQVEWGVSLSLIAFAPHPVPSLKHMVVPTQQSPLTV
jgi:hypothetical protein